ncbi:MAG TPA: RNA pseudouridine synthase, partial [Proteobacteria bacterium]|nr:RNA pseudouridine synthase [Pseudomonadota bacterium]
MIGGSSSSAGNIRRDIAILYEDNHLLVVSKPAGLPVQRDASGDESLIDLAKAYIKERYKKPGNVFATAVHRIDRPASGIVIIARTSKAASRLTREFREGRVERIYLAVVEGKPRSRSHRLEGWILKDRRRNTSRMVDEGTMGAKYACLSYRLLGSFGGYSLLEVHLKTGRSHQARVQLADAGTPVAGDLRYGSQRGFGHLIGLHAAYVK